MGWGVSGLQIFFYYLQNIQMRRVHSYLQSHKLSLHMTCILMYQGRCRWRNLSLCPGCISLNWIATYLQHTDLVVMAAGVQRLQFALERAVLSVQRMFVTKLTGLDHFHCYLDFTQCLKKNKKIKK